MHSTPSDIKITSNKGRRQNLASAIFPIINLQIFVTNVASGDLGPLLHQSMHTSGKLSKYNIIEFMFISKTSEHHSQSYKRTYLHQWWKIREYILKVPRHLAKVFTMMDDNNISNLHIRIPDLSLETLFILLFFPMTRTTGYCTVKRTTSQLSRKADWIQFVVFSVALLQKGFIQESKIFVLNSSSRQ